MIIPFLSLKDVSALHGEEINEAVGQSRVWGGENGDCLKRTKKYKRL